MIIQVAAIGQSEQVTLIPEQSSYFCSELVAAAYQAMGLLGHELPPSDYWPRSFAVDPSGARRLSLLGPNVILGEEQLIDFSLSMGF